MVQKIAWKILREGKHKEVSGVLGFLTRNIADVGEKKNNPKKPKEEICLTNGNMNRKYMEK